MNQDLSRELLRWTRRIRILLTAILVLGAPEPGPAQEREPIRFVPEMTRKVSQLTGETDLTLGIPTLSRTQSQARLIGTDLGSTFEHKGKLVFLFGDSHGGAFPDADGFAFSTSMDPWNVTLQFPLDRERRFLPIVPPGLTTGAFCVPSHGISFRDAMYVVYTQNGADGKPMKRSFLIASADDGRTWRTLFQLPNNTDSDPRFVNVSLEEQDGYIWVFGSGAYRASSPRLARVPVASFPRGWEFYAGMKEGDSGGGAPGWSSDPLAAVPLFDHKVVGELSSAWIEQLGSWVMLYRSPSPKGIVMRTSPQPWGPWSDAQLILDPDRGAFGQFLHVSFDRKRRDLFSDPNRERVWGDAYAPALVKRFTRGDAQRCGLYYTVSTWNPYQVVLMGSLVGRGAAATAPPASSAQRLGHERWARFPANVAQEISKNGRRFVLTHVEARGGDANTGWLWQKLPAGARKLTFLTHGGHSEVFLLEGGGDLPVGGDIVAVARQLKNGAYGRIALRATGVNDNAQDVSHTWDLTKYGHSPLKVVVLDTQTAPWGFVAVSDLEVEVGSGR